MDFPGKSTGVGCHFLLQGIFPTQGNRQKHYWLSLKSIVLTKLILAIQGQVGGNFKYPFFSSCFGLVAISLPRGSSQPSGVDRNIINSLQDLLLWLNFLILAIQSQVGGNFKYPFFSSCFGLKDSEFGQFCLDLPGSFWFFLGFHIYRANDCFWRRKK